MMFISGMDRLLSVWNCILLYQQKLCRWGGYQICFCFVCLQKFWVSYLGSYWKNHSIGYLKINIYKYIVSCFTEACFIQNLKKNETCFFIWNIFHCPQAAPIGTNYIKSSYNSSLEAKYDFYFVESILTCCFRILSR